MIESMGGEGVAGGANNDRIQREAEKANVKGFESEADAKIQVKSAGH